MKLGAIISSMALRSALARASIKRRTRALFSSAFDIGASSSLPTPVSQTGRGHENDATRRSLAHRRRLIHRSAWNRDSRKLRQPFYPFTLDTLIKLEAGPVGSAFS